MWGRRRRMGPLFFFFFFTNTDIRPESVFLWQLTCASLTAGQNVTVATPPKGNQGGRESEVGVVGWRSPCQPLFLTLPQSPDFHSQHFNPFLRWATLLISGTDCQIKCEVQTLRKRNRNRDCTMPLWAGLFQLTDNNNHHHNKNIKDDLNAIKCLNSAE